jgi:hypothetical protein
MFMLNLDMPLVVLLSIPAGFLIAYLGVVLRAKLLKNDLAAKIILIPGFIFLSSLVLAFLIDLKSLNNLSQNSFQESYPGLSVYLILFPAAILYNFLFWKNIRQEIGPSKESFPLWIYQRGLLFSLLGFVLFINYLESLIEVFSIASGAGSLILSIGIPIAFAISLVKIALEDLNRWRDEKERLDEPFQSKLTSFNPDDNPEVAIVFVFDPNSRLSRDVDHLLIELDNSNLYSLNTQDHPDFAIKRRLDEIPSLIALVGGEEVFRSTNIYSKTQLSFNLKKARRQIKISNLINREKDSETKEED